MGARTGAEYVRGLRDSREVWLGNERVTDVTTHPAFRAAVESIATLYDMQHAPAHQDTLCYPSPSSGGPVGRSFLIPRNREDLVGRRRMTKTRADATCGMLGRSADFLNTMLTAWAAKVDYFARQNPACRDRVLAYYEHCCERDLFMTHTLVDPQGDRSKNRAEQDDPHQCLGIVNETAEGLIVRRVKLLATAAPFADAEYLRFEGNAAGVQQIRQRAVARPLTGSGRRTPGPGAGRRGRSRPRRSGAWSCPAWRVQFQVFQISGQWPTVASLPLRTTGVRVSNGSSMSRLSMRAGVREA